MHVTISVSADVASTKFSHDKTLFYQFDGPKGAFITKNPQRWFSMNKGFKIALTIITSCCANKREQERRTKRSSIQIWARCFSAFQQEKIINVLDK